MSVADNRGNDHKRPHRHGSTGSRKSALARKLSRGSVQDSSHASIDAHGHSNNPVKVRVQLLLSEPYRNNYSFH
ncbi:hypothetical protein E2C01_099972 [Portunus trituberculatus]|uniref:Uncharacterized protein n=1 Tax=Portunus trituberculatus TaxID=210409 RepID=A0A5B7K6U5_PORTR|nr:hypothetical protein [Portunus trituberculatus]